MNQAIEICMSIKRTLIFPFGVSFDSMVVELKTLSPWGIWSVKGLRGSCIIESFESADDSPHPRPGD